MYKLSEEVEQRIKRIITESKKCIALLHKNPCCYYKGALLYKLDDNMKQLEYLYEIKNSKGALKRNEQRQKEFTLEELSQYNGKNNKPTYIAVNGVVYDVTNNAAWAAGTHFGITAGKDVTGAFASCHANQPILEKLTVVGKLI